MKLYKISNTPIIVNSLIPIKGFTAMNILGIIFTKDLSKINTIVINHENIHTEQQIECLFVFFYLIYAIEYIINLIKFKDTKLAYRNIHFELEAYNNRNNLDYIENRKRYAWLWS